MVTKVKSSQVKFLFSYLYRPTEPTTMVGTRANPFVDDAAGGYYGVLEDEPDNERIPELEEAEEQQHDDDDDDDLEPKEVLQHVMFKVLGFGQGSPVQLAIAEAGVESIADLLTLENDDIACLKYIRPPVRREMKRIFI